MTEMTKHLTNLRETVSLTFLRLVINLLTGLKLRHKVIGVACRLLGYTRKKMRCLYSSTTELLFLGTECKGCSCDRSNKIFTDVLDFCF